MLHNFSMIKNASDSDPLPLRQGSESYSSLLRLRILFTQSQNVYRKEKFRKNSTKTCFSTWKTLAEFSTNFGSRFETVYIYFLKRKLTSCKFLQFKARFLIQIPASPHYEWRIRIRTENFRIKNKVKIGSPLRQKSVYARCWYCNLFDVEG
jgi:hypothetical protein